jgi:hypothetical protein
MNVWKAATAALAAGVIILGGKMVFSDADAAPAESSKASIQNWREREPHMNRALDALRAARRNLEEASEHHGGWRVLALRHCDESIAETVRGIEYGRAHPDE